MVWECDGQAGVHYKHARFEGLDYVQHCLKYFSCDLGGLEKVGTCSDTMTIFEPWIGSRIS